MNDNENFMKYLLDDDDVENEVEFVDEENSESVDESVKEEYDDLHEQDVQRRLVYAKTVFIVVLICQGLETIALFSILSNLVIFLNMIPLLWSNSVATSMYFSTIFIFFFSVSVSSFLAELFIQPKFIIIWSYIFYLIGSCLMTFTAFGQHQLANRENVEYDESLVLEICGNLNNSNVTDFIFSPEGNNCRPLVEVALIFFAIGSGVLNYHLPFFTFQQLREFCNSASYFFGWHGLVFVIGASISAVLVTFVQFNVNFFCGYLIGTSCVALSFLLFILLLPAFEKVELRNTYITEIKVMLNYAISDDAARRQKQYCIDGQCPSRLSMAMEKYQGPSREDLVREVRNFLRMLPVFCSMTFFWLLSFQACSSYVIQGVHMRLFDTNTVAANSTNFDFLDPGFVFPPTWMFSTSYVTILLLIPLEYYLRKPGAKRMKLGKLKSPTIRITAGLILLMLSFVIAGCVEYVRVTTFKDCTKQHNGNEKEHCTHKQPIGVTFYYATDLHIAWQVPQFVSMTLGQALTLTGIFKFAFNESSNDTRGFVMSAFFFMCGAGAVLALVCLHLAVSLGVFCGTLTIDYCNPNYATMYVYFWVLAAVQLFGILVFLFTMKTFVNFKKYGRAFPLFRLKSFFEDGAASARSDTLN